MNITFTKDELSKFAAELGEWHARKTLFVCENLLRQTENYRMERNPGDLLVRISDEFDRINPRPDWRNYL